MFESRPGLRAILAERVLGSRNPYSKTRCDLLGESQDILWSISQELGQNGDRQVSINIDIEDGSGALLRPSCITYLVTDFVLTDFPIHI